MNMCACIFIAYCGYSANFHCATWCKLSMLLFFAVEKALKTFSSLALFIWLHVVGSVCHIVLLLLLHLQDYSTKNHTYQNVGFFVLGLIALLCLSWPVLC